MGNGHRSSNAAAAWRRFAGNRLSFAAWLSLALTAGPAGAQDDDSSAEVLQPIEVRGRRVANVQPASSYAALATALRYDPRIDLQSRGLPEGQADVSVRGGLFENTGFSLGAVPLFDPQTGHYAVEIPLAPYMLSSPEVLTGVDNSLRAFNASVATVHYGFSRIATDRSFDLGVGTDRLRHGDLRLGRETRLAGGRSLGMRLSAAGSAGDGTLPWGDHEFKRISGHLQSVGDGSETNLLAGYQDKFFGWPGAYTGFASLPETDRTKLGVVVLDHRRSTQRGWWEVGTAYRWLDDDYDFDRRTSEAGTPGSFEHETRSFSLGVLGEARAAGIDWFFSGQVVADRLVRSTDLTYGNFNSRSYLSLSLAPGYRWSLAGERNLLARAGLRADYSNRDDDALLPLFELALEQPTVSGLARVGLEFTRSSQLPGYTALNSAPRGLFGGNAGLGREYAETISLSLSHQTAVCDLRAALFRRKDEDLVDWTYLQGAPFLRQANAVDIDVTGVELMFARYGERADVLAGYSWIDKDADYGEAQVDASFYALNYARQRFTLALVLRPLPSIEIRLDSEYRRQQDNPLRSGRDEALIAAVSLVSRLPFSERARASLIVDNLTDSEFQEFPGTPPAGRQVSLGIGIDW